MRARADSRELARRGASVLGIDLSANLIDKAEDAERHEPLGIRYLHADVGQPGVLSTSFFDAAVCNFGLSDIDDLDAALTQSARPGARVAALSSRSCILASAAERTSRVPGHRPAAYYTEDIGSQQTYGQRCAARSEPITGRSRPISTRCAVRTCGLTGSPEPPPLTDWDPAHDADRKPVHLVVRALKRA